MSKERLPIHRPDESLVFDPRRKSSLVQRGVDHLAALAGAPHAVLLWSFEGDAAGAQTPSDSQASLWGTTVSEGMVYVNRWDGFLYALDVATGAERWKLPTSGQPLQTLADRVYVVPEGEVGHLVALDAETGRELWRSRDQLVSSYADRVMVTVTDSTIYAYDDRHVLHAFDAVTGRERWWFQCPRFPHSAPLVMGDVVVAYTDSIIAVNVASGSREWKFSQRLTELPPPLGASDDTVFQVYGGVLALDIGDGTERWSVDGGDWLTRPLVAEGLICTALHEWEPTLVALDAATGAERWRFAISGSWAYPVAAHAGMVFVEDRAFFTWGGDGTRLGEASTLQAVAATTGEERWRFPGRYLGNSQSHVYVGGWDGFLYALSPTTGTEWWRVPIRDPEVADVVHRAVRPGTKITPPPSGASKPYWTVTMPYLGPDEYLRQIGTSSPAGNVHSAERRVIVTTGHTLYAVALDPPMEASGQAAEWSSSP